MARHGHKRTGYVASIDEIKAQHRVDAYNAGWRRGFLGRPPVSDRFGHYHEFEVGYREGVAASERQIAKDNMAGRERS